MTQPPSLAAMRAAEAISRQHYPKWCQEFKDDLATIIDDAGLREAVECLREIAEVRGITGMHGKTTAIEMRQKARALLAKLTA